MPPARTDASTSSLSSPQKVNSPHDSLVKAAEVNSRYDAFLVLDVESTCFEWPVCLMCWKKSDSGTPECVLEVVDTFRSFVKPTWKPTLSQFCVNFTGVTQTDVDNAPTFPEMIKTFHDDFMVHNGLLDPNDDSRKVEYTWCCDGHFDIQDFLLKQCFISQIEVPNWMRGDFMNVKELVKGHCTSVAKQAPRITKGRRTITMMRIPIPLPYPFNIEKQLEVLGLGKFDGRKHCGIDDTRNLARILAELARLGIVLKPNLPFNLSKTWDWMGADGRVDYKDRID
ncbi:hypothetical protein CERSUDRAFT_123180 [Gelatoporia subvermispora B]|uniref:Exonuclease domain-containing protein n=1 Tax=Ceriporiopsis subvermispora (strain B) TaxID=914234 RepID=M2RJG3_CERS8|nr:hypothetical protein CERSUDRAFT_123180 [Gelatoporia subvermispora B]